MENNRLCLGIFRNGSCVQEYRTWKYLCPCIGKRESDRLNYVVSHSYLKGMAQLLCLNLPKTVKLTINRKMPFMPWLYDWFSKGVSGGYFELSNSLNFEKIRQRCKFPRHFGYQFPYIVIPPTYSKYVRLTVPGEDQIVIGQIEIYSDSTAKKNQLLYIF